MPCKEKEAVGASDTVMLVNVTGNNVPYMYQSQSNI